MTKRGIARHQLRALGLTSPRRLTNGSANNTTRDSSPLGRGRLTLPVDAEWVAQDKVMPCRGTGMPPLFAN